MKRLVQSIAIAAVASASFAGLTAAPVAADRPADDTVTLSTADDFMVYEYGGTAFNACTGELLPEVLVDIRGRNHFGHPMNFVSIGTRTTNADDATGYTVRGTDRIVVNAHGFSWVVNDMWHGPNGERFKLELREFDRWDTPEVDAYSFTGHCLGGETVLPA